MTRALNGIKIQAQKVLLIELFGQATKGFRWMTWYEEAMKDAVSGDMLRGAASKL